MSMILFGSYYYCFFQMMSFETDKDDHLLIQSANDNTIADLSGKVDMPWLILSPSRAVTLRFTSDHRDQRKGFHMQWEAGLLVSDYINQHCSKCKEKSKF